MQVFFVRKPFGILSAFQRQQSSAAILWIEQELRFSMAGYAFGLDQSSTLRIRRTTMCELDTAIGKRLAVDVKTAIPVLLTAWTFLIVVFLQAGLPGFFSVICLAEERASQLKPNRQSVGSVSAIMDRYCVDCHDGVEPAAGLNLQSFDTSVAVKSKSWDTATWEKIVKRLGARQMPPVGVERPSEAEYRNVLTAMESVLDRSAERFPQPGRTDSVRRLNRTEYRNAVRDLLAVDVDVESLLPADQLSHGFDNVTVGELSPLLLGRYITAAEKISRLAVGGLAKSPGGITVRFPADRTQDAHVAGLPLGTRGGALVKHHFPADGQYEIQLRLMRDRDENIEGLTESHDIDVLLDRGLVHRFTVTPPKGKAGYQKDDTLVDAHLKKRFKVTAGPHKVGVTFPNKFSSLLEINRQPFEASFNKHRHPRRAPALFEISIVGPFDAEGPGDTPSRRKVFAAAGNVEAPREVDPAERATQVLRPLVRLAYRRPVTDKDLAVPLRFFKQRFKADGFEAGIETALSAVLVNPHFLLRAEKDPEGLAAGSAYRLTDIELASRLSFFLWSSIPDEVLLTAAERGQLADPDVLKSQVQRMLLDGGSITGEQLRCSVAVPAKSGFVSAGSPVVSQFRRQPATRSSSRDRAAVRKCAAGRSQRSGPAEHRHNVPERATGNALRNSACVRQSFSACASEQEQSPRRAASTWQHPCRHVLRDSDVANDSWQLGSGEHPWYAGTTASAKRSKSERQDGIFGRHDPRTSGRASSESGLCKLSQPHGPDRILAGKI
jgi:hypothetical protein